MGTKEITYNVDYDIDETWTEEEDLYCINCKKKNVWSLNSFYLCIDCDAAFRVVSLDIPAVNRLKAITGF